LHNRDVVPLAYTLGDATNVSGLSRSTLYRHAKAGRLRLVRVGGRTLVEARSLRALLGTDA
jgi:excisionase family DNA binding protein